jgi:2-haloalkanoic acid dehalogenase type II
MEPTWMIKAVLFDLGDTLVYSNPEDAFHRILTQNGMSKSVEEVREALIEGSKEFDIAKHEGLTANEFYKQWNLVELKHLGLKGCKASKLAETINAQWWKFAKFHVFPEVKGTLRKLRRAGLKLGIVTGGFEEDIEMIVPQTGLDKYFDVKVGVDTTGKRKPHPKAFKHALEQLGIKPCEAVFVGDNFENDYVGAEKVGIRPVLLERKDSSVQVLYTGKCIQLPSDTRIIKSLGEIFEVLKEANL